MPSRHGAAQQLIRQKPALRLLLHSSQAVHVTNASCTWAPQTLLAELYVQYKHCWRMLALLVVPYPQRGQHIPHAMMGLSEY